MCNFFAFKTAEIPRSCIQVLDLADLFRGTSATKLFFSFRRYNHSSLWPLKPVNYFKKRFLMFHFHIMSENLLLKPS